MAKLHSNQFGFSAVEAILILAVVAILGFTGWFVWNSQKNTDETHSDINTVQGQDGATGYLVIKEWDVKLPLTKHIQDATYTLQNPNLIHLSTKKLTSIVTGIQGCSSGIDDLDIVRSKIGDSLGSAVVRVGDYFYIESRTAQPACVIVKSSDTEAAMPIQKELFAAFKNTVAK